MVRFNKGDLVIFDKNVMDEVRSYMAGEPYTYPPDFLENVVEYGPIRYVIDYIFSGTILYKISDCEFYVHGENLHLLRVNMK